MKLSITKAFPWVQVAFAGAYAVTSGVAVAQCFLPILSPLISQRKAHGFHSAVCNFPIFVLWLSVVAQIALPNFSGSLWGGRDQSDFEMLAQFWIDWFSGSGRTSESKNILKKMKTSSLMELNIVLLVFLICGVPSTQLCSPPPTIGDTQRTFVEFILFCVGIPIWFKPSNPPLGIKKEDFFSLIPEGFWSKRSVCQLLNHYSCYVY